MILSHSDITMSSFSPDKSKYRKLQLQLKLVQVHMDQSWLKMAGKHKVTTNKGKDILQAKF